MKRSRRFWFSCTLAAALGLVLLGRPRGDSAQDRSERLDVVTVSPRGDVERLNSIDVVFAEPMVPLGGRSRWKGDPPLRLEPPIPGSYSWIGTRALTFVPQADPAPGTEIRAVVPRGARALDGRETDAEYAWIIVVGRPRLIDSSPRSGERIAPLSPLHLLFSAPLAPQAAESIRVEGEDASIAVRMIPPDSLALRSFLPRGMDPRKLAALAPLEPLRAGGEYRLVLPAGVRFEGSAAGLAERIEIPFATFGPPEPLSSRGDPGGIDLSFAGPVDPDHVLRSMRIHPPVPRLRAHALSNGDVRLTGDFRAGRTYALHVREGLTSLLGDRLNEEVSLEASIPHRWEELVISPGGGFVPPQPDLAIRIEATNVDTVEIRGGWVAPDSVPRHLTFVRDYPGRKRLPFVGHWIQPLQTPDSTRVIQIPLAKLGRRPAGAQAVHVRVHARALYPNPQGQREAFSDEAILQITEMGLSAFGGSSEGAAWVTSLVTGKPVPGARVSLHAVGASRAVWSGTTDAEGLVALPSLPPSTPEDQSPIYAQARSGADRLWLEVPRPFQGPYTSPPGVSRLRATYFFDRPLYRPAENVHWQLQVRATGIEGILAAGVPAVDWLLRGPDGREVDRGAAALADPGAASGSTAIPAGAIPGMYTFEVTLPEPGKPHEQRRTLGWGSFEVGEYRLPRFEAHIEPPSGPAVSGKEIGIPARFAYFGGGPLSRAEVRWTLSRRSSWERPEGYWDYQFNDERAWGRDGREASSWGLRRIASGEGTLDADGRIRLPVVPDLSGLEADQVYVLEMGAKDLTDRSAYNAIEFPAFRAGLRVGVRPHTILSNGRERFELAVMAFDTSGAPVTGVPLRATIEKRIWQTVRVRRVGGAFGYENVPRDSLIQSTTVMSGGAEPAVVAFEAPSPGSYTFYAEGTDSEGRTTRARTAFEASGPAAAAWYREDGGWIELTTDKKDYLRSDTARVLIPCPEVTTEGVMLVMDEGMQSLTRLRRLRGSPRVSVPMTSMPPGVHVLAALVGPRVVPEGAQPWSRLPYHGWGRIWIPIRPDPWRLDVQITPDRPTHRPGDEVTLALLLRDASGNPIPGEAAVAVVDDAIFALTGEFRPDPLSFFFEPRDAGIQYADVRFHLSRPVTGEKGEATPGGDGAMAGVDIRRRFLATAYWNPRVVTGADGRAQITFRLPDDLTRFRVRALATSGADRFGFGESKVETRKNLLVEGALPRFLRDGDRIEAVALVRSHLDTKAKVTVRATAEGARIDGKTKRDVKVDAHGQARAVFQISSVAPGGATLRFFADGAGESDAMEMVIPADQPLLRDVDHVASRADPVARTEIEIAGPLVPRASAMTVTASASLLGGCADAYSYVADYPYACVEQRASSLLGIVAQRLAEQHLKTRLAPSDEEQAARLGRIVTTIQECASDWRLRSWPNPGSPEASDYVTGYVLHAATRARAAGIPFPPSLWNGLADETARRLEEAIAAEDSGEEERVQDLGSRDADSPEADETTAARIRDLPWLLWALSEADRLMPPDSLRVRTDLVDALVGRRAGMSQESRMLLALALQNVAARPGEGSLRRSWPNLAVNVIDDVRRASVQRTGGEIWIRASDAEWGDGLGGDERATALYLTLVARADPSSREVQGLVAWLLGERTATTGAWRNQHASALVLELLTDAVVQLEPPPSEVSGRIAVGTHIRDILFRSGGDPVVRMVVPLSDLAKAGGGPTGSTLRVESDGRRPIYFSATIDQAFPALGAAPREEGLIVARSFADRDGNPLPGPLPLGEPLYVHLAVVLSRDARTLLIEDQLPAGLEPLELRFLNTPRVSMASGGPARQEEGEGNADDGEDPDRAGFRGDVASGEVVHSEMRDRSVRMFVDHVRAGVHHWYYPALATTAGRFQTPGARAEALYAPEIYGVSAAEEVRIERIEH